MTGLQWLRDILLSPGDLPGALIYAVLFLLLGLAAARAIGGLSRRATSHLPNHTAITFLAQLLQVVVFLLFMILYAHLVPGLRALGTALLTGASVLSIVIGLAAQSTLGNLIAGFALLLYQPFDVGDELQVNTPRGAVNGTCVSLTLGYTILQVREVEQVVVPNSVMAANVFIRTRRPVDGLPSDS